MSTATMSGSDAVKPAASGPKQQQVKSSTINGGKALDAARKHTASPVDGQKGKQTPAAQPKAWQGPNPITQRSSTHTPNGTEKPLPKLPPQSQSQTKSSLDSHADKHGHDRALFILASFTGHDATLTLKNGEQFTGVFSGGAFESHSRQQYVLKMAKRTQLPTHQQVNGNTELPDEYLGEGEDHVMVFDKDETVDLAVNDVVTASALPTQNGAVTSSFRTDTEISGREPTMPRERELLRWEPGADSTVAMSLEDSGEVAWDQFATNERMYGVESTYDENIYTTAIDRSNPLYKQREAEAARIAREIEGSAPASAHVAEERLRDAERADGLDEEEKYSGVQREASDLPKRSANAYVPPSQRPLTNVPTVPGAPFDPAIISLAKPAPVTVAEAAAESFTTTEPSTASGEQTPAAPASAASPTIQAAGTPKKAGEKSAEDHVRNAADAFKQFANDQKLRARMTAEARRTTARAERNVKLNDLKKFAENFKIHSRVPDDLVPILAKDPTKQIEIQHRAEEAAKQEEVKVKERESQKAAVTASPTPSTSSQVAAPPTIPEQRASFSQQPSSRTRVMQNLRGANVPQPASKPLGQQSGIAPNRGAARPMQIQPLPSDLGRSVGPAIPAGQRAMSPSAATKLNVKAFEFRPGAANTFSPTGASPSPRRTAQSSMDRSNVSEATSKPALFFEGNKKPVALADRKDLDKTFHPVKRLLEAEPTDEQQKKTNAANGGVPKPYQTPPTWPYSEGNVNVSYKDAYVRSQVPTTGPSPMHTPNPNTQMPHAHQLPTHLQGPPMSAQLQRGQFMPPPQGGGPPQGFDPRMQQFGPNGSVQSSPRFPQAQIAYNGQMGMPMPQFGGQQMQGYGMSPNMQYRQMNMPPNGPMMMMQPNQQHGQMPSMPQYAQRSPGGPQYNAQMMGMPMMQQQPGAPFYHGPQGQQQGQSYSPMPPHSQPHGMPAHMHNQGYGGNQRPHMMQHSGSHQGMPGGGMMQQPYGAGAPSPGQGFPYHMQQRQMSSGGGGGNYPHMTPRQQYSVPSHPSPGMGGGMPGQAQGDEGK